MTYDRSLIEQSLRDYLTFSHRLTWNAMFGAVGPSKNERNEDMDCEGGIGQVPVKYISCWRCEMAISDIASTEAWPNSLAILTVIARCPSCARNAANKGAIKRATELDVWGGIRAKKVTQNAR